MSNRNCNSRPYKCCTCPINNNNDVNKTGSSSNQKKTVFDANLQMTNHYKRVNSAKCIVDTAPPKKYVTKQKQQLEFNSRYSTPSLLSANETRIASRANSHCEVRLKIKTPKVQEERSSSVPPQRPATRRNFNNVPQNYLKQTSTQIKINHLERKIPLKTSVPPSLTKTNSSKAGTSNQKLECAKKIIKHNNATVVSCPMFSPKHSKKPTTNSNTTNETKQSNHIKTPIPTPRIYGNPRKQISRVSNFAGVSDYEYLQFSLRITEDIIRNDLYSAKEMRRVFNSHLEANRGRLNTQKMLLQIDHLCKELDIQTKTSRGEKKSCKNRCCNKCATNSCSTAVQSVHMNKKHHDPPSQSTNKELINKIFNGYVMTDEEIFNLSENDLQDVITEILNDHEPSIDGEMINLNEEDNDMIHNNAAQFGTSSEANLKLLSSRNSEESVNVPNAKKVESPVTLLDYLQKVSKQMSENIVKNFDERLANNFGNPPNNTPTIVEEQSESDSKEKLNVHVENVSVGDGQQEQNVTLDSNKQSKDSLDSSSTEHSNSTFTDEYDIIDLNDINTTASEEKQSFFSQQTAISNETLNSTTNQQATQIIEQPAITKIIAEITGSLKSNSDSSNEIRNPTENQKGPVTIKLQDLENEIYEVQQKSAEKQNSVTSNETRNSTEKQQEIQINEQHAVKNERLNPTENQKGAVPVKLQNLENEVHGVHKKSAEKRSSLKQNSATSNETRNSTENQQQIQMSEQHAIENEILNLQNKKLGVQQIPVANTGSLTKLNSVTANETRNPIENQKRALTTSLQDLQNKILGAQQISEGNTGSLKRISVTSNESLINAIEDQKRSLTTSLQNLENEILSVQQISERNSGSSKRNSLTSNETLNPIENQKGALITNLHDLENEILNVQQLSIGYRNALKRNSYTLPSTSIVHRNLFALQNTEKQNNSPKRDSSCQATSDEQREILKRNSYTLPSTSITQRNTSVLKNTDGAKKRDSYTLPSADNKSDVSHFNSITEDQYIALKRDLVSQSISDNNATGSVNCTPISKVTVSSIKEAQNTVPEMYSDKTVTKIFPLSAVNDSWLDEQEKSISEAEIELEDHISYFNESKEHMSEIIEILLEQLSVYDEDDKPKSDKLSDKSKDDLDLLKSPLAYSYDNASIFSAADSLSDEGKSVCDADSVKLSIAKTVSKFTPNKIKIERTEKDEVISSITKYILQKTFATAAQNPEQIEEPKEENDFISTVEKLVNDRTNDLYQYCFPEKPLTEFPSRSSLDELNKYETDYSKHKNPANGYKSSKRKSSKSDISEGELSKTSSSSTFLRNVSLESLKKTEPHILQHLKKYESKPQCDEKNSLQPCLCEYELKNLEKRNYDSYVPKFCKSLFYPTVSTQTSNTDFNNRAGFNDTLLSDGEVQFTESESESFSR